MQRTLKTIDLFAGMGGVRLAFEKAGFQTVFANDFDEKCAETYNANYKDVQMTVGDIRDIPSNTIPDFDLLLGGFPCQPFSVAGYKKGFDDERGTLFFEIERIVREKQPVGFFLENVRNLSGTRFKTVFSHMLERLEQHGYSIKHAVLNTKEYGNLPQQRERVYLVGFKTSSGLIEKFSFPKKLTRTTTIADLLEHEVERTYYYKGKPLYNKLYKDIVKRDTVYQWRRNYVRENKSKVCPTVTANMGTGGHNVPIVRDRVGIRKLTPRECALFQGFPKSFILPDLADSSLYKQIGNSVSVPVVERIARNIMRAWRVYKGERS